MRRSWWKLRTISAIAIVVLLALTVLGAWVTHVVVRDQEGRLLKERTSEVALVLSTSVAAIPASLSSLGGIYQATGQSAAAFDHAAAAEVAAATGHVTFALLRPTAGGFVVEAAAGGALTTGQVVSGVRAATLSQASQTRQIVATPVIGTGARRVLGFALGAPAAPAGTVIYRESALGPVSAPRQATTAPFHELNVVLYDSTVPDPNQVLVATTQTLPLPGTVRYQPLPAGASHWLLGASAQQPLVGSVAASAPWVVLAAGVALAVLVGLVVEIEARRRDGALALYDSEHHVAETLQRSLLPELPDLSGLELAARYIAGGAGQRVGGDWFDVFAIADGKVGVVIGDVIGHDPTAAAAMAQIRATLRAYAWQGDAPAPVLERLDQLVDAFKVAQLVTVFYGVLDSPTPDGSRRLRYANAGHLAPLVKTPDGEVQALAAGTSVVIGAPIVEARDQGEQVLPAGSTLLLFTDGLVEVPRGSLSDSLAELDTRFAAFDIGTGAERLCDHVLENFAGGDLRDDIAVLVVRILPTDGGRSDRALPAGVVAASSATGEPAVITGS